MRAEIVTCLLIGGLGAGCSFDSSGVAPDDPVDARPGDGDGGSGDAGSCPEPLRLSLRIQGQDVELEPGLPAEREALLGDLIELSAASSCTQSGDITYAWSLLPHDKTLLPASDAETITFYPTDTLMPYEATVTISNGTAERQAKIRVTAHGWEQLTDAPGGEIRDLDVDSENLWIAAEDGPFRLPLVGTQDTIFAVNDEIDGSSIDDQLSAVYVDRAVNQVWFGKQSNKSGVWQVLSGQSPFAASFLEYNGPDALDGDAAVIAIGAGFSGGVAVATTRGLTQAADRATFEGALKFGDDMTDIAQAIASDGTTNWAGARQLYKNGIRIDDPFGGTGADDRRIRALAVDMTNDLLWVGTDGSGIVCLDHATGAMPTIYDTASSGLLSDKIRQLRVETQGPYAGDVWAATDKGIARYIRGRDTWFHMGMSEGLGAQVNVNALAIDEADNRRVIYGGTTLGVVYIRVP